MKKKEQQFKARNALVKEVCEKYYSKGHFKNKYPGEKFYFDLEHGLALCTHSKVRFASIAYTKINLY